MTINGAQYKNYDDYAMDLVKEPWPWHIVCGFITELGKEKLYEAKKQELVARAQAIASSPHSELVPDCLTIPAVRYRERVIEVFHLELGDKNIHCVAKVQTSIKKRNGVHKYSYRFCYHHKGHCPHSTKLKLKRKHV